MRGLVVAGVLITMLAFPAFAEEPGTPDAVADAEDIGLPQIDPQLPMSMLSLVGALGGGQGQTGSVDLGAMVGQLLGGAGNGSASSDGLLDAGLLQALNDGTVQGIVGGMMSGDTSALTGLLSGGLGGIDLESPQDLMSLPLGDVGSVAGSLQGLSGLTGALDGGYMQGLDQILGDMYAE